MRTGVVIESVVAGLDGWLHSEYICIYNNTGNSYNLAGWKMVYYELPSEGILHTHKFETIKGGSFGPKERLRLISCCHKNHFHWADSIARIPYWDIYTGIFKNLLNTPSYKVALFNEEGKELDSLSISQYKNIQELKNALKQPVIFIGHGQSQEWLKLKDHLQDKHGLTCVAFETEERAGITIPEIIASLGKTPDIALLVLTGEDKMENGNIRARQNVIHELGLFQAELGNHRAIPITERGVEVLSNIAGTQEIRFEADRIQEIFGDVLAVLRREFILF